MSGLQRVRNWSAALLFVAIVGGAGVTVSFPHTAAAAPANSCNDRFLTFPAWYRGLLTANCDIRSPSVGNSNSAQANISVFIWTIVLNVVEMMLQLVGYISVGYIIAGGYRYIISAGAPDGLVKARKTITNAVIGLVVSIFSVAIVNVVAGALK